MKEGYSAKERLTYVTMQLMLQKGFNAASLDEICALTGVSKGSFFHHFKNKEEAAAAALDYFWQLLQEELWSGLDYVAPKIRTDTVLERMARLPETVHFEHGSLLALFALELANSHPALREQVLHIYAEWAAKLADLLRDAGAPPADALALARQGIATCEGALILYKTTRDREPLRQLLARFAADLNKILDR